MLALLLDSTTGRCEIGKNPSQMPRYPISTLVHLSVSPYCEPCRLRGRWRVSSLALAASKNVIDLQEATEPRAS